MQTLTTPNTQSTTPAASRRRVPALSVLVVLILLGAAAALPLRPPAPQPASAPAGRFSAERAFTLLGGIATVPHPTGSPAQGHVREYLLGALRNLGLEPHVITRVAARSFSASDPNQESPIGTVSDIHARIPGRASTGRVLLVAHYDSVPNGPGASDNGANVAAVLEVARALRAGPQPRNDIDLLFTDGEEYRLLGAQAFVDSREAGDPGRVVVVNLDARGVSGPAIMFDAAGPGLGPAVRASGAVTTSLAGAIYRVLPVDTDLTILHQAGMRGLNFAFIDDPRNYHTSRDDIDHVSHRTVQDMGDAALAAVRHLAAADLAAPGSEATYFSLFGVVLWYPNWLVLPLAAITIAGYLLLLWWGRRRGLRLGGVGRAAVTLPLTLVLAAAIGLGGWWILSLARPDFAEIVGGFIYHLGRYALGEAALLLVVLAAWYRWVRRRASPLDIATGVLGWFGLLSLASAVLMPSGAYVFTWPALIGLAAIAAVLRFTDTDSPLRPVAACAAAAPAVVLLLPVALLLLPAVGLSLTAAPLLLAALLTATMVGVFEALPSGRWGIAGMATVAVAAAASIGICAATDAYDADEPRAVSLGYAFEADTGKATWVSAGGVDQPVVGRYLTGGSVHFDNRLPPLSVGSLPTGPAPVADALAVPSIEEPLVEERDGIRSIQVRIKVPAGPYSINVYADTTGHEILDATVNGVSIRAGRNRPYGAGNWGWGFNYAAPPADGIVLHLRARGQGPLRLLVISNSNGLPTGVGAPTLPPDLVWASWPSPSGQTLVTRTFRL